MGLAVDASRHAAHDDETGGSEVAREGARDRATIRRARSRPHDERRPAGRGAPRPHIRGERAEAADRESRRATTGTSHRGAEHSGSPSLRRELAGHPVRERLGDVSGLDRRVVREGGNRSRHPRNASAPATRERKPIDRARQELRRSVRPSRRRRAADGRVRRVRAPVPRPMPPPAAPRAPPHAAAASRQRGRTDRAEHARASPCTRRAAATSKRTRRQDPRGHRTGTYSWFPRAESAPGRSRARRRERQRRSRPRAAVVATRGRSAGTPGARP